MNISGRRDHAIVEHGKQILLKLMHRGAAGADESTGDGAGILLQIPHEFFQAIAPTLGFQLPAQKHYGVAMLFLPQASEARRRCEQIFAEILTEEGLQLLGWRDVPTDNSSLGDIARAAEPFVRQAFIGGQGREDEELERRLYVARKRIERRVLETMGEAAEEFYVPSMSCRTIVYKGMFLAPQLFAYYADLGDDRVQTALAVVPSTLQHQHVPKLAAGPTVPYDRPQRRNQHPAWQRESPPGPRKEHGLRTLDSRHVAVVPDRSARWKRLGLLRQCDGIAGPRGPVRADTR